MSASRTSLSIGMLLTTIAVTCTGCLTKPKDGQNIIGSMMPFQAAGYFPNVYQTQPDIVLQAYNYGTQNWETVAPVWFVGSPRYLEGSWYYPWRNDSVYVSAAKYWERDPGSGLWRAKFRAYDRVSGLPLPPTDDATLQPTSGADHVRLYAYF